MILIESFLTPPCSVLGSTTVGNSLIILEIASVYAIGISRCRVASWEFFWEIVVLITIVNKTTSQKFLIGTICPDPTPEFNDRCQHLFLFANVTAIKEQSH